MGGAVSHSKDPVEQKSQPAMTRPAAAVSLNAAIVGGFVSIVGYVSMKTPNGRKNVPVTVDDPNMLGCAAVLQTQLFLEWVQGCENDPRLYICRVGHQPASGPEHAHVPAGRCSL